jgi:hypothetical protein
MRLSLWSSGQSSWLQIQRSWLRFPMLTDFLRSSGLERGPLCLVSTTEELLGRNSSGSGLESLEYCNEDQLPRLALTLLTRGCRSVDVVRSRTKATKFRLFYFSSGRNEQGICPIWRRGRLETLRYEGSEV